MGEYTKNPSHSNPTMDAYGSLYAEREGNNVKVWGSASLHKGGGYGRMYGYHFAARIHWNGVNTGNWFYIKDDNTGYKNIDKTWTVSYSYTLENCPEAGTVSLHYICCGTGDGTYGNPCNVGYVDVEVASVSVDKAYTASSIWLNPNDYTKIAKVQDSSTTGSGKQWGVHYSYNAGSNTDCPISLAIQDYNNTSWSVRWEPILRYVNGSSDGVWDYYNLGTDKGFTDGNRYRITLVSKGGEALSPNSWDPRQGLTIYTYKIPTINDSITISRTSQNANQDNKFTISGTNDRAWSDYEQPFQTRYRIKRGSADYTGWTNVGNITSWSRSDESSNKPTQDFVVYYRPRVGIGSSDVSYKDTSNNNIPKGKIIAKHKLTDITVTWNYDTNRDVAGYTQGYRVRLYNNANTVVKTYYTTSKSYKIPANDIPSNGLMTYVDITPYYANDSSDPNSYWYYNGTIEKMNFVIVMNKLAKPVITYPINNSNWINDDFRICFQLPTDPDYASVSGTYKYDNIEFEINGTAYKFTQVSGDTQTTNHTLISYDYTFSSLLNDLTYQKKITIWPNANNITKNSTYAIRVRVKKPYNATADTDWGWSDWSDKVTIVKVVPSYSVSKGDFIMATHYNTVRDAVNNAKNTYGITGSVPDKVTSKVTIILQNQYKYANIFQRIVETKNVVNNYAPVHTSLVKVKFDYQDRIITSFTTTDEWVTALKDDTNGKNYMKYIFDNVTLLK